MNKNEQVNLPEPEMLTAAERIAATAAAHADMRETLGLLAEQLNYPRRIDKFVDRKRASISQLRRNKPTLFFAVAGTISVAVGALTATVVAAVIKN